MGDVLKSEARGRINTKHEPQEGDLPIFTSSDHCHVPATHKIKVKKLYNRLNVDTYMGRRIGSAGKVPRHPPSYVEAWHMVFQSSLECQHANPWKLIKSITEENGIKIGQCEQCSDTSISIEGTKLTLTERGSKPNSLRKQKSKIRQRNHQQKKNVKVYNGGEYDIQRMDNKKELVDNLPKGLSTTST
ncbi:unnamed protein product [Lepeophtheirus salmonis]|uniref:(salmon louse) hypothetical protein n=1 Tax=Lepeophtheirus salmonis TaxID=72036 RepID=A0A7R8CH71_LEPSM|nr:unnamed protein product [Lepeophtheirus salmonis]CAF2821811.1 unnamed protein product [Lepeophtheirus salmonis]